MIAVDTNILVHAHRKEMQNHHVALARLHDLAMSGRHWAIPWPCVHEFIGVVTRESLHRASTIDEAFGVIEAWLQSRTVLLIAEGENHWNDLRALATRARLHGPMIHDARIAAICLAHGVTELWTNDRDFSRFPGLKIRNPLAG